MKDNNEKNNEYKLFVGNVSFNCKKIDFVNCFNIYEGFISAELIHDEKTFKTRGFGFVIYNNKKTFDTLLNSVITLNNRNLRLTEYKTDILDKNDNNDNYYKIFIKTNNIINKDNIEKIFNQYGKIYSIDINFNTCVITYLNKISFRTVLNKKTIIDDNIKYNIYPYKKFINYDKHEQNNQNENTDIYRAGFNHGSDVGYRNGYRDGYRDGYQKALLEIFNKKL